MRLPARRHGRPLQCRVPRPDRDGHDEEHVRRGEEEGERGQDRAVESAAEGRPARRDCEGGVVPGERRGQLCQWAGVGRRRRPVGRSSFCAGEAGVKLSRRTGYINQSKNMKSPSRGAAEMGVIDTC